MKQKSHKHSLKLIKFNIKTLLLLLLTVKVTVISIVVADNSNMIQQYPIGKQLNDSSSSNNSNIAEEVCRCWDAKFDLNVSS